MNCVNISGFIYGKIRNEVNKENGQKECNFMVSTSSYINNENQLLPCKTVGNLAELTFSEIDDAFYVEITGELAKSNQGKLYILCHQITYKKPKSRRQFYITQDEFIKYYKPSGILERLVDDNDKK